MSSTIHTVAFIGTGIMGAPIAGHFLDAGYALTVHNRTKAKADALVARGATWAPSPAEAVAQADVVFTMLGYPTDVEEVYLDKGGIIAASKKGAWLVDLTTSSSQLARDIHDAAEVMDKHALDCPVTGGERGAIDGTLTLMVGATETDVAPILPALECFSSMVYYLGAAGHGQTVKLCNQVALASAMVGYADALALAETAGIDGAQMVDIVSHGMGGSVAMSAFAPKSVAGDYKPGFLVEHLRKDLGLALMQADDAGMALPGAQNAFDLYDALCKIGGSRLGTQALTLLYQDQEVGASAGLDWSLLEQPAEHGHGRAHHHHHDGHQH